MRNEELIEKVREVAGDFAAERMEAALNNMPASQLRRNTIFDAYLVEVGVYGMAGEIMGIFEALYDIDSLNRYHRVGTPLITYDQLNDETGQ